MVASGHPMGNFSVNHYSRLDFGPRAAKLTYVLDLAEIPTFQLLGEWNIDWKDQALLSERSRKQAEDWVDNLILMQAGQRVPVRLISSSPVAVEGAGGMPILRISIATEAILQPGDVTYEDRNFPGRAGWKEIVVDHDPVVALHSSLGAKDLSKALTYYPTDPSINPPQELLARINWSPLPTAVRNTPRVADEGKKSGLVPPSDDNIGASSRASTSPSATTSSFSQQQPEAPGTLVRGDFLSRMLQRKELAGEAILIGILVAFGLGAMHAMSPGHGKTIVAAYLVGNRGTLKHAGLLGLVVTLTHTATVFLLGLGMLFFQKYVVPEKIVPILGTISGLSVVLVGMMLLYRRAKALLEGADNHSHAHSRHHDHEHFPELAYAYAGNTSRGPRTRIAELREAEGSVSLRGNTRETPDLIHQHDNGLVHSHGGSTHSHMIEGDITPGSLVALGISGGMVPCPSALILMLSAIALGHPGVGLVLLVAFSVGLALVLIAIGALAVYAKHLLPKSEGIGTKPIFRLIPIFSAVVVICLGFVMAAVSAGWIRPMGFLS
jgi:nickel/cobalt exporter